MRAWHLEGLKVMDFYTISRSFDLWLGRQKIILPIDASRFFSPSTPSFMYLYKYKYLYPLPRLIRSILQNYFRRTCTQKEKNLDGQKNKCWVALLDTGECMQCRA